MNRKQRLRRKKFKKKLDKLTPYFIGVAFALTLFFTQFFQLFYISQRNANDEHRQQEPILSSIFDFSTAGDIVDVVMNLQEYFKAVMTSLDLNQLYSFINDGFAFINLKSPSQNATAAIPSSEGYRYTYKSKAAEAAPDQAPTEATVGVYPEGANNDSLGRPLSVVDLSYMVAQALQGKNIGALVESRSVAEYVSKNSWSYASSYKASRVYLEDTASQHETLKYFIDFHRDSVSYANSTITIDGKPYAKIMFVLGTDNDRHEENHQIIKELDARLNEKYPGLSRGIRPNGGAGFNGVYNQDFATTMLLIEVGGEYNTYEEVYNTAQAVADVLAEYVTEN